MDEKGNPKPEPHLMKWAKFMEEGERRRVALTVINTHTTVSTVFLGLDHSFGGRKPQLYETMVFGGKLDGGMERYATRQEAEKGHQKFLKKLQKEPQ